MLDNNIKTVVVIGMHGGGISVTSGMLNILGADMFKTNNFNPNNIMGYYEDDEIHVLNKKIFDFHEAEGFQPKETLQGNLNSKYKTTFKKIFSKKKKLLGFNDPVSTYTFPYFYDQLKNAYFIFVYRNPYDINLSMKKSNGFSIENSLKLASEYYGYINKIIDSTKVHPQLAPSMEKILKSLIFNIRKTSALFNVRTNFIIKIKFKLFVISNNKHKIK